MPCILHGAAKKIRNTISRQVSGLAQLPDDLKFIVDQESNTLKSGGETWWFLWLANDYHDCGDMNSIMIIIIYNDEDDNNN